MEIAERRSRICSFLLLACFACGESKKATGLISVVVQATGSAQLTQVTVTVTPASVTADLTRDPNDASKFAGELTVPVGDQAVNAVAYAGATRIGAGAASLTVAKGQRAQVFITILDAGGPSPVPDHSPVVTSLVVPASRVMVGDQLALGAAAFDADGNAMTFAWSASPAGCGSFSAPAALSTSWTAVATGPCVVTFAVTANAKSDSRSASIQVDPATGIIDVVATFVPWPVIDSIAFGSGGAQIWAVSRTSPDATAPRSAVFHKGTAYAVTLTFEPAPDGALDLQDSCAGTIVQPSFVPNATTASASWTPAVDTGACVVTAHLTRQGLVDSFPVVLQPVP